MTAWLLLLLADDASYGYELLRELAAHGVAVEPASVYRTLRRLERDDWVESRWMRAIAGPRRRFYRLTPRGRRMLGEVAGLITVTREVHDAFLRAYDDGGAGAGPGCDDGEPVMSDAGGPVGARPRASAAPRDSTAPTWR